MSVAVASFTFGRPGIPCLSRLRVHALAKIVRYAFVTRCAGRFWDIGRVRILLMLHVAAGAGDRGVG